MSHLQRYKVLWHSRKFAMVTCGMVGLLTGCASMRYGGAPEPSFDVNRDLEQLAQVFEQANTITEFYKNPTDAARNKFIIGRVTLMNIRYIQFVRQLTSDRQLLDSASGILMLGLNLAGTSVSSAATKTLLAAIAAGVTGSKQVIDKNYYFEQTIPALVGQMNAERKKALVPLLVGMKGSLDEYRFEQAVTDLHSYYFAGTFTGAIQAIQMEAAVKERQHDDVIATLTPLTIKDVVSKQALTTAIGALSQADLDKAKKAVQALDPKVTPADTLDAVKQQLQGYVRGARTPELIAKVTRAFRDAGIPLPE